MMIARGQASEVTVYQVRFGSDGWLALAPVVAKVQLPDRADGSRAKRVPPHLLHLFWNTAPAQLDVATSAPYIARRLIMTFDPDGLAWGTVNLPASAWEHAAATRGLEPARRALANNLAEVCARRLSASSVSCRRIPASTWETIARIVPPTAYLGGGTAIAVHLRHRESADLDFFFHRASVDLDQLVELLRGSDRSR